MVLKAVLFDFNGVIINDEPLHENLLAQILLEENMRANPNEFREVCLGRSDRACLQDLLMRRGRVVSEDYLTGLIARKSRLYQQQLESLEAVPTYSGITDLIFKIRVANLAMAVVSGAVRSEIEWVLNQLDLAQYFSVIVAGDDITTSKPDPTGYLLAVDRLNQQNSSLALKPEECLVIEDTFSGIEAAKNAGMKVVGVANSYPYHMMQRQSNWAVDYLSDLELDRVLQVFAGGEKPVAKD
jgi:beta-phosphoglucomutase